MGSGNFAVIDGEEVNRYFMKNVLLYKCVFGKGRWFISSFFICICLFLTGCREKEIEFYSGEELSVQSEETREQQMTPSAEPQTIFIDVCGAVKKPGVYELSEGSRVFQAVEAAGGFAANAADEHVNRAKALNDGEQVYIPTKKEVQNKTVPSPLGKEEEQEGLKVNLNTADKEALMELSGIGESKAEAIIAYREENGGFHAKEDILNVQGIKEGTYEKIKDDIVVE